MREFLERLAKVIVQYEDSLDKIIGVEVLVDEVVYVFNGQKFEETKRNSL